MKATASAVDAGRTALTHHRQDKLLHGQDCTFVSRGLFAQIYKIIRPQNPIRELEGLEFLSGQMTIMQNFFIQFAVFPIT